MVMSLAGFGMILLEDYKNGDEPTVWRTLNVTRATARRARSIAATITPSSIRGQARASVRTVAISPDRGGSAEVDHAIVPCVVPVAAHRDMTFADAWRCRTPCRECRAAPRGRAGAARRRREPVVPRLDRVDQLS